MRSWKGFWEGRRPELLKLRICSPLGQWLLLLDAVPNATSVTIICYHTSNMWNGNNKVPASWILLFTIIYKGILKVTLMMLIKIPWPPHSMIPNMVDLPITSNNSADCHCVKFSVKCQCHVQCPKSYFKLRCAFTWIYLMLLGILSAHIWRAIMSMRWKQYAPVTQTTFPDKVPL